MENDYVLEWLDVLVTDRLSPQKVETEMFDKRQAEQIIDKIVDEKRRQCVYIKRLVLLEPKRRRIQHALSCYFGALNMLIEGAEKNIESFSARFLDFEKPLQAVLTCLCDVRKFIIERYSVYLDPDMPVMNFRDISIRREFDILRHGQFRPEEEALLQLLWEEFENTFGSESSEVLTLRKLEYWSDLHKRIIEGAHQDFYYEFFSSIEISLIGINFNNARFVKYLADKVLVSIDGLSSNMDKVANLTHLQKLFNQIPVRQGLICDIRYNDLQTQIDNWFRHEIKYYTDLNNISPQIESRNGSSRYLRKNPDKIMCALTVDQIALFFKAADQLSIITARSLSAIFKTIAPHLSTPHAADISPESLRAKSYSGEERDKAAVLDVLARLIKKVEEA